MAGGSSLTNPPPAQVPPVSSTNQPSSTSTQQSLTSSQPTMSLASIPTQSTTKANVGQTVATTTAPVVVTTVVIGGETIEYVPAGNMVCKDAEVFYKTMECAALPPDKRADL
jgi:hypothetical protein